MGDDDSYAILKCRSCHHVTVRPRSVVDGELDEVTCPDCLIEPMMVERSEQIDGDTALTIVRYGDESDVEKFD